MDIFDEGRKLLSMSKNNPEFIEKYSAIRDSLSNYRSDNADKLEEARNLVQLLSVKAVGEAKQSVGHALRTFNFRNTHEFVNTNYLDVVTVSDLLYTREVCKKFIQVSNYMVKKGMHECPNVYSLNHLSQLALKLKKEIDDNAEERWDTYNDLRFFLVEVSRKHLVDIGKVIPHLKLVMYMDAEALKAKSKYRQMKELQIFSNYSRKAEQINTTEITNKLFYFYILEPSRFHEYYKEVLNNISKILEEGKVSKEEYNDSKNTIMNLYNYLFSENPVNPVTPVETFSDTYQGDGDLTPLLIYNSDEIIKSYRLCRSFLDIMTDKNVVTSIINYRQLKSTLLYKTKVNSMDLEGKANIARVNKSVLDLLLRYNLISLDEHYELCQAFQLDRWL